MMSEEPEKPLEWHINRLIELGVPDGATLIVRRTYGQNPFMFIDVMGPPSVNYGGEVYAMNARSWDDVEKQVKAYWQRLESAALMEQNRLDAELNAL